MTFELKKVVNFQASKTEVEKNLKIKNRKGGQGQLARIQLG